VFIEELLSLFGLFTCSNCCSLCFIFIGLFFSVGDKSSSGSSPGAVFD